MFDVDTFKEVNDTFGHAVGDRLLEQVAHVAGAGLRSADLIGRYGGDEFVIVLPMTTAQQAFTAAERIRAAVSAIRVPTPLGDVAVTLSIGIAEMFHPPLDDTVAQVINRADEAMYQAKQTGRNRTVTYTRAPSGKERLYEEMTTTTLSPETVRHMAEERVREQAADLAALSPDAARYLPHELRVHQVELEMQNEELRRSQMELVASRARYFDLYELAPVGFFTLSDQGLILEANLTAATLLGVARGTLLKLPLTCFILPEDQDIYYRHRKKLLATGSPQVCELQMVKRDGTHFRARLEATAAKAADGAPEYRALLSDITGRKPAEEG
jgi:diguanylate cyclase (GGDEF)-like protein/PAS domain S-box-containing protein